MLERTFSSNEQRSSRCSVYADCSAARERNNNESSNPKQTPLFGHQEFFRLQLQRGERTPCNTCVPPAESLDVYL
jgi:hypothetical protein